MGSFQLKKNFVSPFICTNQAREWTNTTAFYIDFKTSCYLQSLWKGKPKCLMPRLASQKIVFRTGLYCAIQPMGQLRFHEGMFPVTGSCYLLVVQKGEDAPPEPPVSSVGLASECYTACAAGFTKYLWQRICRSANLLVHLPTLPRRACFSWEFSQQDSCLCWVHNPFGSSEQVFSCLLLYSSSSQLWSTQEVYLWRYQSAETRNSFKCTWHAKYS